MAAAVVDSSSNESTVKLLRRPLPCKKKTPLPEQPSRVKTRQFDKDTTTSTRKVHVQTTKGLCTGDIVRGERKSEDLNKPEWEFKKPRGPDPFPLRPIRRPFPLDKQKFLQDSYLDDIHNRKSRDGEHGHGVVEQKVSLPGIRKSEEPATPRQSISYESDDVIPTVKFDQQYNASYGIVDTQKDHGLAHLFSLDLRLPDEVNIKLRKPWRQMYLEGKAQKLQNENHFQYVEQNSIAQLEPMYVVDNGEQGSRQYSDQYQRSGGITKNVSENVCENNDLEDWIEVSNIPGVNYFNMERDGTIDEVHNANTPPPSLHHNTTKSSSVFEMKTPLEMAVDDSLAQGGAFLDLKAHFIDSLPDLTFLWSRLTHVNLSFNYFIKIPQELLHAKQLEVLRLRNNPITEIPTYIKKLKKLKVLVLSFCCINVLPKQLFKLNNLEQLDLSYNGLTSMPNEIRFLTKLKELNVEGNQMRAFPRGVLSLDLKTLKCSNNFLHPLLWKETAGPQPQGLADMCARLFVKEGLHFRYTKLPESTAEIFKSLSLCDYCAGPKFREGVKLIKPVVELFGNVNLPIIFYLCSQGCRKELKKATQVAAPIEVVEKGKYSIAQNGTGVL